MIKVSKYYPCYFSYDTQRRAIRSDVLGFKWMHFYAINLKDKRTLSNCGITT